jgi:hypothetical protein
MLLATLRIGRVMRLAKTARRAAAATAAAMPTARLCAMIRVTGLKKRSARTETTKVQPKGGKEATKETRWPSGRARSRQPSAPPFTPARAETSASDQLPSPTPKARLPEPSMAAILSPGARARPLA